jgi:NADP-dependent 3-hydroxy acid dehydrogenase YdfG
MSKTLLITGGASGIGAETARHAATRGYAIAINYRTRDTQARKVVADIEASGGKAIALPGDMAREADIVRLFGEAEKALGPITHLVNSAGTNGKRGRVDEYDAAVLANLFATNVTGLMLCCREAAKRMSTRHGGKGGSIVNVSSMAATLGGRLGSSAYAASKGAVDAFTKGFAREVAAEGSLVDQRLFLDPRHHRAELLADLLDRVLGHALARGLERGLVDLVLQHPVAGEAARLDVFQHALHLGLGLGGDDARAGDGIRRTRRCWRSSSSCWRCRPRR